MEEKRKYIRVRASLMFDPSVDLEFRNNDGTVKFSEEFTNKLLEQDAVFREPIITFINDEVGTHNWAIQFSEFFDRKKFDARIYCPTPEDYHKIVAIIQERIPDMEFIYHHSGTLDYYIGSQD